MAKIFNTAFPAEINLHRQGKQLVKKKIDAKQSSCRQQKNQAKEHLQAPPPPHQKLRGCLPKSVPLDLGLKNRFPSNFYHKYYYLSLLLKCN